MGTITRRTVARKTVPVTAEDAEAVDRVRQPESSERAALAALGIELSANPSEAEVLQALVEVGRSAVQRQVMASGYAALAAARDREDEEFEREVRGRRRSRSED